MIRLARIDEVRTIAQLVKGLEQETKFIKVDIDRCTEYYTKLIQSGLGVLFVVEVDGLIVGSIGCIVAEDMHLPRKMAVELYWYVHPEHRGEGMQLLKAYEEWAYNQGCAVVALTHPADCYPEIFGRVLSRKGYTMTEYHYEKVLRS